jgi:hypothetical protein
MQRLPVFSGAGQLRRSRWGHQPERLVLAVQQEEITVDGPRGYGPFAGAR